MAYQAGITINTGITPRARFALQAWLLHKKRYHDHASDLVPTDYTLGWAEMSDQAMLDQLDIAQYSRWWHWHTKKNSWPAPRERIQNNGSNMHLIAATPQVQQLLDRTRHGPTGFLRAPL